jgi:hypothetical protein
MQAAFVAEGAVSIKDVAGCNKSQSPKRPPWCRTDGRSDSYGWHGAGACGAHSRRIGYARWRGNPLPSKSEAARKHELARANGTLGSRSFIANGDRDDQRSAVSRAVEAKPAKGGVIEISKADLESTVSGPAKIEDVGPLGLSMVSGGGVLLALTCVKQFVHTPELEAAILTMTEGGVLLLSAISDRLWGR